MQSIIYNKETKNMFMGNILHSMDYLPYHNINVILCLLLYSVALWTLSLSPVAYYKSCCHMMNTYRNMNVETVSCCIFQQYILTGSLVVVDLVVKRSVVFLSPGHTTGTTCTGVSRSTVSVGVVDHCGSWKQKQVILWIQFINYIYVYII